jgi:hypothetical protein
VLIPFTLERESKEQKCEERHWKNGSGKTFWHSRGDKNKEEKLENGGVRNLLEVIARKAFYGLRIYLTRYEEKVFKSANFWERKM